MENTVYILAVLLVISQLGRTEDKKRHVIYWDPAVTASVKDPNAVVDVEIGQFMDILCPLKNYGTDKSPPAAFDIHNVTAEGYKTCNGSLGKAIFSCNLPDQENKLTIKFQLISPSPFGFRFQRCESYYFLAVPHKNSEESDKKSEKGCTKHSQRLRIRVACEDEKSPPKPTRKTTTTKPKKTNFIKKLITEKKVLSPVVPEIVSVTSKLPVADRVAVPNPDDGGNGANSIQFSKLTAFIVLVSCILSTILSS